MGLLTFHCDQTLHFAPHFITLWTQNFIANRLRILSIRLPVSIGAFVKTIANDEPNAQCQPLAHSMRPNLSNISRFQSIAVVQPRAKGLYDHFSVSERLGGIVCQPQTMELSVFLQRKTNSWHSAVGSDEHGTLRVVPESGPSWHSKSVFDRTTLHPLGLFKYYCSVLFRDLGAQNDPLVVRRVGYIHFVGNFLWKSQVRFISYMKLTSDKCRGLPFTLDSGSSGMQKCIAKRSRC